MFVKKKGSRKTIEFKQAIMWKKFSEYGNKVRPEEFINQTQSDKYYNVAPQKH